MKPYRLSFIRYRFQSSLFRSMTALLAVTILAHTTKFVKFIMGFLALSQSLDHYLNFNEDLKKRESYYHIAIPLLHLMF